MRAKTFRHPSVIGLLAGAASLGLLAVLVFFVLTIPQVVSGALLGPHELSIANGRTMFEVGGCASCHGVPNQPDRTRLGGGLPLASPFGTFYVPNISSDTKDGSGHGRSRSLSPP